MLKRTVHLLGRWYLQKILQSEANAQMPRAINERPVEIAFVFDCIREIQPATVLDVGTGQSPLPALVRNTGCTVSAVDNIRDYWPNGMFNRHWLVRNEDITKPDLPAESFDAVTCVSVIEHIREADNAFRSMINVLRPGGHLILTMPYNERRYVPDVYKLPTFQDEPQPYPCASYDRAVLDLWLDSSPASILRQDFWQFYDGDAVWRETTRLPRPKKTSASEPHQLTCLLIQRGK